MPFTDRFEAAHQLARKLEKYKGKDAVILAIPRGGLQTGSVLAKELKATLDIILTKKIGHPLNEEFAIGAVSLTGQVIDEQVLAAEGIDKRYVEGETVRLRKILQERYDRYLGGRKPLDIKGKTVIITDDGIATGNTMMVAVHMVKQQGAKKVVVAVPVGPPETIERLRKIADEVVCLETPSFFMAIGQFYQNFEQVEDEEAIRLLKEARS